MNSDKGKWIRFRIYVVTAIFVTGLGVLWARAFQLQVTQREWLTKTARKGYVGLQDHGLPVWYRNIKIKRLENRSQ